MSARQWHFTWNVCDNAHLLETQRVLETINAAYIVYQLEKAPKTGQVHWQGLVAFKSANNLKQIKKKMPGAHLERALGDATANKKYCTKEESRDPRNMGDERGVMPQAYAIEGTASRYYH